MNEPLFMPFETENASEIPKVPEGTSEYPDLTELYASADAGFPEIPKEREVDFETLLHDTNLSPEALAQYRVKHAAE